MKKKTSIIKAGLCFLGLFAAVAVIKPIMLAEAGEDSFVTWHSEKKNEVQVSLCLQPGEAIEDVVTFQVGFQLEGDVDNVEFTFSDRLKRNNEVPVKEYLYDDQTQTLMVYVSGRDTILGKKALELGNIQVDGTDAIEISIADHSCVTVDRFHTMKEVTEMGAMKSYNMNLSDTEPSEPEEPSKPEEPSEPEEPSGPEEPSEPEEPSRPAKPSRPETTVSHDDPEYSDSNADTEGTWLKDGESWSFKKADGTQARNEWVKTAGKWYKLNAEGKMETGWIQENGTWYYCGPDGAMNTEWIQLNGVWYYLGNSGAMQTGWVQDKSFWYYLKPDGAMTVGWVETDGAWYYMNESGQRLVDTVTPDGYRLDRNGKRVNQ